MERLECEGSSFFQLAERFGAPRPLQRCLSLVRQHRAEFVYIEPLGVDGATAREINHFAAKNYLLKRSRTRLSFSKLVNGLERSIGYCIVHDDEISYLTQGQPGAVFDQKCYVSSAVIEPPEKPGRFVTCAREFPVDFRDETVAVEGAFFCQQPGHTGCCAHASVTAVAQLMGVADDTFSNLSINELFGLEVYGSPAARDGLSSDQIKKVLESLGLKVDVFGYAEPAAGDVIKMAQYSQLMEMFPPQQAMYIAVESGFPVLFAFQLGDAPAGHVVAVIGHELNKDTWLAEARYDYVQLPEASVKFLRSSSWTSHFVALDDNYGPYCALPNEAWRDGPQEVIVVSKDGCNFQLALLAEPVAASELLNLYNAVMQHFGSPGDSAWSKRLYGMVLNRHTIMRTMWTSRESYLRQTGDYAMKAGAEASWAEVSNSLEDVLPDYFWLVEVSIPELYATNGGKLADIVLAQTEANELELVAARLPEYLFIIDGSNMTVSELPEMDGWHELLKRGSLPVC